MREAAALRRQNAVVGVGAGKLWHADAEAAALLHALEDEVDSVGVFSNETRQARLDVVLLAHSLLGPLQGELVVVGISFDPVLVVTGSLTQHLFTHHRDAQDLADKIHHLLGPR